ncbi:MAG: UDP-N-acetylglucosamine 2-epimerase (non-hydrolyzing) [Acidimicrobiia bacterium]
MSSQPSSGSIAVVLGTRPEIIKLAAIVRMLGDDVHLVHTGQHYDAGLSRDFFQEFGMREPDTAITVGGQSRGAQIGNAATALDELLGRLSPLAVVVQGDTNAVTAGCLAANAREIPLVHVEAGLRSFDRRMPEEHNRVIADHLSDLCLAPTAGNVRNLGDEGIGGDRVALTGNPVVEAVGRLMPSDHEQAELLERHGVERDRYLLATLHRPENVDDRDSLATILGALTHVGEKVLLPLHPRTRQRINEFGLSDVAAGITIVEPVGYRSFLALGANARLIVSDSGGVQEEVSVYKRPAIVVRRSTERQEVEGTFVTLTRPGPDLGDEITEAWDTALDRRVMLQEIPTPYGSDASPGACVAAIRALIERTGP